VVMVTVSEQLLRPVPPNPAWWCFVNIVLRRSVFFSKK
jgi:hypothetical protein